MDRSYGELYRELYRRHWWWRAREHALLRVLERRIGRGAAGEILDVGCGDGLFFDKLTRFGTPWGVEPDARLLSPDGRWRSHIATAPVTRDESQHGRYGLILALDVLEHIDEPTPVVEELGRRLRPGGLLVATVPAFRALWTAHDVLNEHKHRYRLHELEALIKSGGLRVLEARYFFVWLAVLKAAVTIKERLTPTAPALPRIPPAPLNAVFHAAALFEQALLRHLDPPFGSSAMIVAAAPLNTDAPPSP